MDKKRKEELQGLLIDALREEREIFNEETGIELKKKCEEVLQLRNQLIEAEEALKKDAGTFRSMFKKVEFTPHCNIAVGVAEQINGKLEELEGYEDVSETLDETVSLFLKYLYLYTTALSRAARSQCDIACRLNQKSVAEANIPYTYKQFKRDTVEYNMWTDRYASLAGELSVLYDKL